MLPILLFAQNKINDNCQESSQQNRPRKNVLHWFRFNMFNISICNFHFDVFSVVQDPVKWPKNMSAEFKVSILHMIFVKLDLYDSLKYSIQ